jgi:hypothetical protein
VTGLVTEVLVMLPAATVIAIHDLQPPQVRRTFPPPAIFPATRNMKLQTPVNR